jgi:hypothetical protein
MPMVEFRGSSFNLLFMKVDYQNKKYINFPQTKNPSCQFESKSIQIFFSPEK